ncbi:hypothetical protein K2X30_02630 [bacterium]|jgi:hypothetical protein|nr:hypothetical protein [bacterium]
MKSKEKSSIVHERIWIPAKKIETGQALVEFTIVGTLIVGILAASFQVLRCEWVRLRCAHQLFEKVHLKRVMNDSPEWISEEADCGLGMKERVKLPALEAREWE